MKVKNGVKIPLLICNISLPKKKEIYYKLSAQIKCLFEPEKESLL